MKANQIFFLLTAFIFCLGLQDAQARQTWTVKGKLKVQHDMTDLKNQYGSTNALKGVKIKVYARSKILGGWGTWNAWPKVTTKSDGSFSISKQKNGDRRQFKVKILFDNDELMLKEGQETSISFSSSGFPIDIQLDLTDKDWHEVYNDKNKNKEWKAGVCNLGTITLKSGVVRTHGDIWFTFNKIFDRLDQYGGDFGFNKKVKLKYPMGIGNNGSNTSSYANPLNNVIYIKETHDNVGTIMHELMHIWIYQHCHGEDAMAWQLVKHQDTHADREYTTFVPFHEASAEILAIKLWELMTGSSSMATSGTYDHVPYSRKTIKAIESEAANVDYTEKGWMTLFNILTHDDLGAMDFNSNTTRASIGTKGCASAKIGWGFKKLLKIHLKFPNKGYSKYIKKSEMDFDGYLARAKKICGLTSDQVADIKVYLNPKASKNPDDLNCNLSKTSVTIKKPSAKTSSKGKKKIRKIRN